MKYKVVLFFLLLTIFSCTNNENNETKVPIESNYVIKTFKTDSLGWGYDILENEKKLIHQPHIPAVAGVKGFKTEADAQKTAELIIQKLKNNIMPPSVSEKELDSLGISH